MARFQFVWQLALVCAVLFLAGQANGQIPASNAAVEAAIRNPRYMRRQINCLLNESPCDNIGRTMKRKFTHFSSSISVSQCSNLIVFTLFTQNWYRLFSRANAPVALRSSTNRP